MKPEIIMDQEYQNEMGRDLERIRHPKCPRDEGFSAEYDAACPYPEGTKEAAEWDAGWVESHGDPYDVE